MAAGCRTFPPRQRTRLQQRKLDRRTNQQRHTPDFLQRIAATGTNPQFAPKNHCIRHQSKKTILNSASSRSWKTDFSLHRQKRRNLPITSLPRSRTRHLIASKNPRLLPSQRARKNRPSISFQHPLAPIRRMTTPQAIHHLHHCWLMKSTASPLPICPLLNRRNIFFPLPWNNRIGNPMPCSNTWSLTYSSQLRNRQK